ncbi:MAG: helix-turn-helix domain-containing protein [Smithellaceae bacterium]
MTTENNADPNLMDLKTARENSGLSLKDLFNRTRISMVYLEAMENGDFHLLPVPTYARNFIKTYADALGVDKNPVLHRYENYLKTLQTKGTDQATEQPSPVPGSAMLKRHKAFLWILLIITVFAATAFFVSTQNKPLPNPTQKTNGQKEMAATQPQAPKVAQPELPPIEINLKKAEGPIITAVSDEKKQQAEEANLAKPEDPSEDQNATEAPDEAPNKKDDKTEVLPDNEETSTLVVQATEETWIRIQADNKEAFQVLLRAGEKITHKAARFNVDLGNAGGVRIAFNGKNIENLGKSGQVIHLRLP